MGVSVNLFDFFFLFIGCWGVLLIDVRRGFCFKCYDIDRDDGSLYL